MQAGEFLQIQVFTNPVQSGCFLSVLVVFFFPQAPVRSWRCIAEGFAKGAAGTFFVPCLLPVATFSYKVVVLTLRTKNTL